MIRPADEWFAKEDFWEALYPFLFSEDARAAAVADVAAITALVRRPVATVLDLCCGPGRHSVPFAQQGIRVTGVDRSVFLLGHARRYAAAAGVEVRWVEQDMRDFIEPEGFELAISLFTSFGYFEDPTENQRVLRNVHASLAPGGAFVIDLAGKEVVARIFQPCRVLEHPQAAVLVQRAKVIDDWSRVENEWVVIRDGRARTFRFRHWLYSAVELRDLLRDAGFVSIDVFGSLNGAAYGAEATRLVARAYKPA